MYKGNTQSLYGKVLTLNLIDCIILMYWPCTVSKCLYAHVTWQGSWNGHETLPENLNKRVTTPLFRVVSTDWGTFYGQITLCNQYRFRFHLSGMQISVLFPNIFTPLWSTFYVANVPFQKNGTPHFSAVNVSTV